MILAPLLVLGLCVDFCSKFNALFGKIVVKVLGPVS